MDFKNKKVSILGLARSGKALARALSRKGAHILVSDVKTSSALTDVMKELSGLNLEWETGGHTDRIYKNRDIIIISPGISIYTPILQEAMEKGVPVVSEVEIAFLLTDASFIAVTGTNGKSTTSTLIHQSLINSGKNAYLAGNIGIPLVGEVEKIPPGGWITAEISSFQLEAVERFHPHIAVLLNITNDHIDRHGSFEKYRNAKANLFNCQVKNDFAVLNADDPSTELLTPRIKSKKLYFSRTRPVKEGAYFEDGKIIFADGSHKKAIFSWARFPLQGVHNIENTLAAACVCHIVGIDFIHLRNALESFRHLHYRMEFVAEIDKVQFYNDSKGTNPDAVRASLESFNEPVILIAGGTDKGLDFMPLAKKIQKYAHGVVLIGESREKIARALEHIGFTNYAVNNDLSLNGFNNAIQQSFQLSPRPGVVLLSPSCASFDMFNNAEHRGAVFNQFVKEMKQDHERTQKV